MTRSGIKQGLAVSAVAALATVGLPAAAHAASPIDAVTISSASASAQAYQTVNVHGVTSVNGVATGNVDVTVTLSQTLADKANGDAADAPTFFVDDAAAAPAEITANGPVASTANAAAKTHTFSATYTVTSSNVQKTLGQWSADVASSVAGSLSVQAGIATLGATPATASTSVTVSGKGSENADDATSVKISSASAVKAYVDSTIPANSDPITFDLNATDGSNGVFVPDFDGSTGGTWAIASAAAPTTPLTTGTWGAADPQTFSADPYTTEVDIPSAGLSAGNYVVEFWVNQDNHASNTAQPDAGEPTALGSVTVTDEPTVDSAETGAPGTPEAGLKYDDGLAYYGTATAFDGVNDSTHAILPTDTAATIPLSFQVYDQTRSDALNKLTYPAAGTSFAIDVTNSTTGKTTRVPASYDASTGLVTASTSVAAADVVDGTTITAALFVSKDATDTGAGAQINSGVVSTFKDRTPSIKQVAAYHITATKGGAVSIPVVVADQFGKASAGDTLQFVVTGANSFSLTTTTAPTDATGRTTISYTNDKVTAVPASDSVAVSDTTHPTVTGLSAASAITVNYINGATTPASIVNDATTGKPTDPESAPLDANGDGVHDSAYAVAAAGTAATSGEYKFRVFNSNGEALSNTNVVLTATGGQVTWTDGNGKAHTGASVTATTGNTGNVAGVYLSSTKVGNVALTVSAGAASYSFAPIKVTKPGAPYSIAPVTAAQNVVPGASAKFVFKVTDEWGNPVEGAQVAFTLGSNTAPGTLDIASAFGAGSVADKNGNVVAVLNTASNDKGTGSVVATPVNPGTPSTLTWASAPAASTDGATATYTDPTGDGVSVAYTVSTPVVTPPSKPTHPVTPAKPAAVKINKATAKSMGKKDVLTVRAAHANGKRVVVKFHGKRVGHGVVKHGKVVIKVNDKNGNKKSRYQVIIAGVKKFVGTK